MSKTVLFQTIQFCMSIDYFLFKNSSIPTNSVSQQYADSMSKTVIFETIPFSKTTESTSFEKEFYFKHHFCISTQFQFQKQLYLKQFSLA